MQVWTDEEFVSIMKKYVFNTLTITICCLAVAYMVYPVAVISIFLLVICGVVIASHIHSDNKHYEKTRTRKLDKPVEVSDETDIMEMSADDLNEEYSTDEVIVAKEPLYATNKACYDVACDSDDIDETIINDHYETDDENDYEYASDGKRMCFINYNTGHVVYHGDELFHVLKQKMLYGG